MIDYEYYNRNYLKQEPLKYLVINNGVVPFGQLSPSIFINSSALYLGEFSSGHYGNFLFDYLCRLWYVLKIGTVDNYIYVSSRLDIASHPEYLQILSSFGINENNLIHIKQATAFKTLIVPEESFIHDKYYSPQYITIYKKIKESTHINKQLCYDKVYFTRTKLKRKKEIGEKIFELFFKKNGYTILSPEKLSFAQQISVVNNCHTLASIEGTLAHNIIFGIGGGTTRQIILKKQSYIIPRQFQINQAVGIPAEYVEVYSEPFSYFPLNYDRGPFLLWWNKNIIDFAKREKMAIPNYIWIKKPLLFFVYLCKCLSYSVKYTIKDLCSKL